MPDPIVFPAGVSIAAFVIATISWYGMLRTGMQLVHDDWKAAQTYKQDVWNMIIDLNSQERALDDWRKQWMISEHTPDRILPIFWGEEELRIVKTKLALIETDCQETKKKLEEITGLTSDQWGAMSDFKKKRKAKFIWAKKNYLQKLIDRVPNSIDTIDKAANRGWQAQKARLHGGVSNTTPYHTQIAQLLAQIAKQTRHDLNALCQCTRALRGLSIELDLDIFDAVTAISKDIESAAVAAIAAAGHMRLELLLRESGEQAAEIVRARVERSLAHPGSYARAIDAFRSVMTASGASGASIHYFASNASTIFSLCKSFRKHDPCSPVRESLRQKISRNAPPYYDCTQNQLQPCVLILGDLSTFRVAYELSQACLMFLRTNCVSELCGCGLRCGGRQLYSGGFWYEFGLNMETEHQPPRWRDPSKQSNAFIEGSMTDSWCMARNPGWNTMTTPLRRMGLLLIEITLGTVVVRTENDPNGSITHICLLIRGSSTSGFIIKKIRLENILALVRDAVHGSDGFTESVRCCLTRTLDQSPDDAEWENSLKDLYFEIVKP